MGQSVDTVHRGMTVGLPADLKLFVKGLLRKSSASLTHCKETYCRNLQKSPCHQTPHLTPVYFVEKRKWHRFRDAFVYSLDSLTGEHP